RPTIAFGSTTRGRGARVRLNAKSCSVRLQARSAAWRMAATWTARGSPGDRYSPSVSAWLMMAVSSCSKSLAIPPLRRSTVSSVAMPTVAAERSGDEIGRHVEPPEQQQRDGFQQSLDGARLVEKRLVGPERHLLLEQAIAESGQVEDLERRVLRAQPARELVAGHLRHHHVGDENVEVLHLRRVVKRLGAVAGDGGGVARLAEHALDKLLHRRLVVDDQCARRPRLGSLHTSRVILDIRKHRAPLVAVHCYLSPLFRASRWSRAAVGCRRWS